MALSDIYSQAPWTPSAQANQDVARGFAGLSEELANTERRKGQEQANRDAAAIAPGAEASPYRKSIAQQIMMMAPGHTPEHEQRLMAELGGGQGQGQPSLGGRGQGGPSPYPAPGAEGPVDISRMPQGGGLGGAATQMPRPDSDQRNYIGGSAPSPYAGDMTGMGRPARQPMPQVAMTPAMGGGGQPGSGGPGPGRPGPVGPQSNYDVETALRMGPFMKQRDDTAKLELKQKELDQKNAQFKTLMAYRYDALKGRKDVAELSARVRMATSDADRKAALKLMEIEVRKMGIHAGEAGRIRSSLPELANDPGAMQAADQAQSDYLDAQREYEVTKAMIEKGGNPVPGPKGGGRSVDVSVKYRYSPDGKSRVRDLGNGKFGAVEPIP